MTRLGECVAFSPSVSAFMAVRTGSRCQCCLSMTFVQLRLGRKRWGLLVDNEQAIISEAPKVWPTMSLIVIVCQVLSVWSVYYTVLTHPFSVPILAFKQALTRFQVSKIFRPGCPEKMPVATHI